MLSAQQKQTVCKTIKGTSTLWCLWSGATSCKCDISLSAASPASFWLTNHTLVCLWISVYWHWGWGRGMLVRLCVMLRWSGAPAVRCPGSGDTQRDSTEGIARLLSHVAKVKQTSRQQPFQWNSAPEIRTYVQRIFQIVSHHAVGNRGGSLLPRFMEEGSKSQEVKSPETLVVYRATLAWDRHVSSCGLHQMSSWNAEKQHFSGDRYQAGWCLLAWCWKNTFCCPAEDDVTKFTDYIWSF